MTRCAALVFGVALFSFATCAAALLCAAEPQDGNPFEARSDLPVAASQAGDPTPRLEAKIRQALKQPAKFDFTETPLRDVIDFLKDQHGIEIQLDSKALEDEAIGTDAPITRSVDGVSLAVGLKLLLHDLDLTYVVRDGVMLITTQDAARRMLELRVYDVGNFVKSEADADLLAGILETVVSCEAHGAAPRPAKPEAKIAQAAQAEPSRLSVVPFRNLLLVKASQQDHEQIAQLLAEILAKVQSSPGK
jgi:hypothetical protein